MTVNSDRFVILVDHVRSLYNIGAIFRTADAVGVDKIYLAGYSGTVKYGQRKFLHPKLAKTALAGVNVAWEQIDDPLAKIKDLKKKGFSIICLEQTNQSIDYTLVQYQFPICLVIGHEREGVSQPILDCADFIVELPMRGRGKSLNVASASAVVLYEINRQIGLPK